MYVFQINKMVEQLIKARVVHPADQEKASKVLSKYWQDSIAVTWTIDDVIDHAKELGKSKVTKKQAREVLAYVMKKHDATVGINWDMIGQGVNHVMS